MAHNAEDVLTFLYFSAQSLKFLEAMLETHFNKCNLLSCKVKAINLNCINVHNSNYENVESKVC